MTSWRAMSVGGRRLLPFDRDNIRVDLEAMALPSDLVLVNEGTCPECWHGRATCFDFVSLDRRLLAARAPRIDLEASYVIPAATEGLSLLKSYVALLRRHPPGSNKVAEAAARHVYDLMVLVLAGAVRGGTERNENSIAAAPYRLIEKDVLGRLCDRGLQIEAVARRQGVTVRYVQRLFENAGTTFSEFVRGQRLEQALGLMEERDLAASTITAIACDVGFSDVSSFNRAFRKRFDATPSEFRADILSRRAALPRGRG
uniref:Helix-turn-helix transcriptional regulator n=1 Tax=Bosea sp. NBC_00436 TaxID=2969620 RepID=A0A9E7ZT55_9HYPH